MRKVTIIGAGPGNPDLLSRAALDAIDIADVVIGAHRALAGIDVPPDVVRCELVKTADIVAALQDVYPGFELPEEEVLAIAEILLCWNDPIDHPQLPQRYAPPGGGALRRRAGGRARCSRHKLSVVSRRAPCASMAGLALRERSRRGVRHRGRGRARR